MTIQMFVHGSRENTRSAGLKAGLRGDALNMFSYAAEELTLDLEVEPTGHAKIVRVDDRHLASEQGTTEVDWVRDALGVEDRFEQHFRCEMCQPDATDSDAGYITQWMKFCPNCGMPITWKNKP